MREAEVDPDLCDGCQECVSECLYGAIEMVRPARGRRLKAVVDNGLCCGCHACAVACPQHGIEMRRLRPLAVGEADLE